MTEAETLLKVSMNFDYAELEILPRQKKEDGDEEII